MFSSSAALRHVSLLNLVLGRLEAEAGDSMVDGVKSSACRGSDVIEQTCVKAREVWKCT